MSTALVQVSFARDAAYTALWARSVTKFVSGFARICLFVPTRDRKVFEPLLGTKAADGTPIELIDYFEGPEHPHWAHQYQKCTMDLWLPEIDWFCYCDADTIFIQPATPAAYFHRDEQAILLVTPFAREPDARGACWRNAVAHSLGIEPLYETMQWPQICHHACTLEDLRLHIEKLHQCSFWQHVMARRFAPDGVTPMNFAEFSTLGSFAIEVSNLKHFYHVVETGTDEDKALPRFVRQGWSHNCGNPVVHAQELADFGRIIG